MKHNTDKCNYEWEVTPGNFLYGNRCPQCSENVKKTTELFKSEVYNLVKDDFLVLGEYKNNRTKIKMKHNSVSCNFKEFEIIPYAFLRRKRCPICNNPKKLKTLSQFKKEVYMLVQDEYTVLGNYINNKTKIEMIHNTCNNPFSITPHSFTDGHRCPFCSSSKGEYTIRKYLNANSFYFQEQYKISDCKNKTFLRFDFAVFDKENNLKLLIEYNGKQHYEYIKHFHRNDSGFVSRILLDSKKRAYCEYNSIALLEISYKDIDNIENILDEELKEKYSNFQ